MVQPEFLAKNQLPSICPDPIVIPNLARISNKEHPDRLLCPIRALKFYLKMTKPYCQNRTRLFLPIKGEQDISKSSVSRWISYTIKLAYRKFTRKDFPLKIKAHEVKALSSSWAFFDKVPLSEILKAAVWNQSSTFAKFYLRDMSQQLQNLKDLGPIVVAQKVVRAKSTVPWMPKKIYSLQNTTVHILRYRSVPLLRAGRDAQIQTAI